MQKFRKFGYFEHQCGLERPSDTCLLDIPPYLSKTQKWCVSLKRYLVIDENSKRTKEFFRSYAEVMAEKRRQAQEHFRIIHPFSPFAVIRERVLCLMWFISFLVDPVAFSIGIINEYYFYILMFQLLLDIMFFVNIIATCFVGYYLPLSKEMVRSPKKIIKEKLFWYLIPELLACFPCQILAYSIHPFKPKKSRLSCLGIIKSLRIVRIRDFFNYLNNIFNEFNMKEDKYMWIVVFLINFFLIFWAACLIFFINSILYTYDRIPHDSMLHFSKHYNATGRHYMVIEGFHKIFTILLVTTTCHFFGATEGFRAVNSDLERVLCSILLMFGYFCCILGSAKLLEIFGSSNISATKYEVLKYQVDEYGRSKNLPELLKKRMTLYYEYKFQRKYFKEDAILSTLSEHLRHEVVLHGCRNILDKVNILQGMPKGVIGSILSYMRREIYLPNDVVLKYGEPLTKMYWISFGTLSANFGPQAIEILHFVDGDHFGDLSITRQGGLARLTVIALEITEIFTISRKEISHCTAFLKEMREKIAKTYKDKITLYNTLASLMTDEDNRNTVLADLRKGRILERDHLRRQ